MPSNDIQLNLIVESDQQKGRMPMVKVLGKVKAGRGILLPFYRSKVPAGFPSPAADHIEERLDPHEILTNNSVSTYVVQVYGDSMIGAGIEDKSFLVVDRSLTPKHNDIVIVSIDNEFTVKRIHFLSNGTVILCPENPKYQPITLSESLDNILWGVVVSCLKKFR